MWQSARIPLQIAQLFIGFGIRSPRKASRDIRKMRHHIEQAPVEQAVCLRAVTRRQCRPVSVWRVAGWRMGVNGNVRESREFTKGVLSTSDKGHCVNFPELDFVGLAALWPGKPVYLLPEAAPGVWRRGSVQA